VPDGRIEWGILALGLAALAVLGALIVSSLGGSGDPAGAAATRALRPAPLALPPAQERDAGPRRAAAASPAVRLRLTAVRGDSWLEVRTGSADGAVLFSGTLTQGSTRTFRAASRLWIRFGGASSLDADLNGRPLALRFGTYDMLVTPRGLASAG